MTPEFRLPCDAPRLLGKRHDPLAPVIAQKHGLVGLGLHLAGVEYHCASIEYAAAKILQLLDAAGYALSPASADTY